MTNFILLALILVTIGSLIGFFLGKSAKKRFNTKDSITASNIAVAVSSTALTVFLLFLSLN